MQGLKVLPTIGDEIARANEIVDGQTHARMDGKGTPMPHHTSRSDKNINAQCGN